MKSGLTAKLFLALLAVSVVVVLAMGVAARASFTRGFLGYINEQGIARIDAVVPALAAAYREHGDWEFLRSKPRNWFELMRPARDPAADKSAPRSPPPESDLTGIVLRVTLLDEQRRFVIGNRGEIGPQAAMRPIVVDDRTVGWLAIVPFQQVTSAADVRFQQQQLHSSWIIAALSVLLAAALAFWLSRWLLAPVKRIAAATHRLAAGDYSSRVEVSSGDEIGRLAEDFNQLALALGKNEQMRRAFMADVSHELRTPLAVLGGELEALEDGVRKLTPEALKSLQAEVKTLSKLVSDLYDLSLSDVGALAYRKADVDVADVLQLTLGAFRKRLAERHITLDAVLPEAPVIVLADEGRLQQLFNNLIENSLRYTDAGGQLYVSCRENAGRVEIDFQDSKPGVEDALLPKLFERFYRVEGSRNRASGGAGLGLAICRNIVEAHEGRIEARHSPLGGLWIALSLPLASS
jgi:two-component system sensor histidine kinase BaeS